MQDAERRHETCNACGAVGHGNMTCSACVRLWPRFGISQASVDALLASIGDRLPDPPLGTRHN